MHAADCLGQTCEALWLTARGIRKAAQLWCAMFWLAALKLHAEAVQCMHKAADQNTACESCAAMCMPDALSHHQRFGDAWLRGDCMYIHIDKKTL